MTAAPRRPRPDRRVERSKQALRDALIALMHEHPYERISVADIAERANVGRSTFYVHFADKDDLLVDGIDQLKAWLRERGDAPEVTPAHPALAFVRPMIEHAEQQRALFRALVGRGGAVQVSEELHRMLAELVRVALGGKATVAKRRPAPEEAIAEVVVGAFMALLRWWLERDSAMTAAEVEATFTRQLLPGLAGWTRR
ncbi:MAG: TetR/AcrR family transcriptional regulator [Myxococcales bacterium]|nr:TetR/AcrR family transcriptional regulator [Myxococcales bacterium]